MSSLTRQMKRAKPMVPQPVGVSQKHGRWMSFREVAEMQKEIDQYKKHCDEYREMLDADYQKYCAQAAERAMAKIFLVVAAIIFKHGTTLLRTAKSERIKLFDQYYKEYLDKVEEPTPEILEVEKAVYEQLGYKMIREDD